MASDERLLLAVAGMGFLTLREKLILLKEFSSSEEIGNLDFDDVSAIVRRPLRNAAWNGRDALEESGRALRLARSYGIKYVLYGSGSYPALLRECFDPPFMLFYRGDISILQEKVCVSMVGTRRACAETLEAARTFACEAALDGRCVVSGLALGIDAASHKGALSAARDALLSGGVDCIGTTAAVLPCGLDSVSPQANKALARGILESGGCLLGEYLPGTPPMYFRYVQRNRIIAALSSCTVVVHAPAGSGALITAQFALDEGRHLCFHSAGFTAPAKRINSVAEERLRSDKKKEHKLGVSAENFIRDGAPVIAGYSDYCGLFKNQDNMRGGAAQPSLFD